MTLENCQRLLKHYQDLADGTIEMPFGHKDWGDVVANAKVRASEMEKRVAKKLNLPQNYNHPLNAEKRKAEEKAKLKAEAEAKLKAKKEKAEKEAKLKAEAEAKEGSSSDRK